MRLQERVARQDADRFVGREHELALLGGVLADDSPHVLAWVSGGPGYGKTALLRQLVRRASAHDVVHHGAPGWEAALLRSGRPLLVVDAAPGEELALRDLRLRVLPSLPDGARVVVAAADPAGPEWWSSVWASALLAVRLAPLPPPEAAALLAARGLTDPDDLAVATGWAQGHPLSLVLVAAAMSSRPDPVGRDELAELGAEVLDLLTRGLLADADLLSDRRAVLAVAALAPAVDADLLGAVLGRPGRSAEEWLRSLPFAVRVGTRVALPNRVRSLLAEQLRHRDPDLERTLRLALIDHLTASARDGRPRLMIDIREVLDAPEDHGMLPSRLPESPWLVDHARPADLATIDAHLADRPDLADLVRTWTQHAPGAAVVVRRRGSAQLVALGIGASPATVPPVVRERAPLAGWRGWVLDRDPSGPALLTPVVEVLADRLDESERGQVGAALLTALAQRSDHADFRWWLCPRRPGAPDPAHCGGVAEPALDLHLDGERTAVFVIDYGHAGVIAALREQAHRAWAPPRLGVGVDDVRAALREYADTGGGGSDLARQLPAAVDAAFGRGRDAALLRDVVVLGYLAPGAGHAHAMRTLHVSRTTYFRRLREAVGILAAWLSAQPSDHEPEVVPATEAEPVLGPPGAPDGQRRAGGRVEHLDRVADRAQREHDVPR